MPSGTGFWYATPGWKVDGLYSSLRIGVDGFGQRLRGPPAASVAGDGFSGSIVLRGVVSGDSGTVSEVISLRVYGLSLRVWAVGLGYPSGQF